MKVLLRGTISDRSIEGRHLLGMADAFVANNARVYFAPGTVVPPIPRKRLALLLTQEPPLRYDLLISTDPSPIFEEASVKLVTVAGLTAESPWIPGGNTPHWDAVLHQDPGSATVVRDYGDVEQKQFPFVPGLHTEDFPWLERDWFGSLNFLVDTSGAKEAIEAFDYLKEESTAYERTKPNLAVVDLKSLDTERLTRVFKDFNVLLCTDGAPNVHQEFMATGGAVLARFQGVHNQWLSNTFSYRYVPILEQNPSQVLAGRIGELILNPEEVYRKAELARLMAQSMDWTSVLDKLFLMLEDGIPYGKPLRNAWLRLQPVDR